jgi:Skp family chaperone for outer membrane proteins
MRVKILLLILINLCLLIVLLYMLEFAGVINYYSNIKENFTEMVYKDIEVKKDDPNLIEKEEYQKLLTSINMREADLKKYEQELENLKIKLETDTKQLTEERIQLQNQREKLAQMEKEKKDYQKKVRELANSFMNMPPESSVDIIVGLDDDLLILDVLDSIDSISVEQGQASIRPFLMSLMPTNISARLARKSTITP